MSGIRELFTLMYWVNNEKKSILETSFKKNRPVSKLQKEVEQCLKYQHDQKKPPALKQTKNKL